MPNAVFDPGGGGLIKPEFDLDGLAPHDADGVFDVVFNVEVQGDLKGVIGEGHGFDAFDCEHAHVFSEMTISDEIQGAVGVPQAIGANFSSGGLMSGCGAIPHLHCMEFGRGLGQCGDGCMMPFIGFMGAERDGKCSGKILGCFIIRGGHAGFGFGQSGLQGFLDAGAC